jgi:hypothetical protein
VLLSLFCVGVVLVVGGTMYGAATLVGLVKDARDPALMPAKAREVAQFPEPLPANFSYLAALGGMVQIEHKPEGTVFWIIRSPQKEGTAAKALVVQAAHHPPPFGPQPIKTTSEGTQTVGGEEMYYQIGDTPDGRDEIVGAVVPKAQPKQFVLMFAETPGGKLNQDAVHELLSSIKGF